MKPCLNEAQYDGETIKCIEGYMHGRRHLIRYKEGDFTIEVAWYADTVKEDK